MWRWMERREDAVWHREVAVAAGQAQAVPHSHEVAKNREGYLGSERSQPQARLYSPGIQHHEDKSP